MRNVYKINAKVGGVGPSSKPDDVVYKAADKPRRIKSKIFPFFFLCIANIKGIYIDEQTLIISSSQGYMLYIYSIYYVSMRCTYV